jgi:hypothetical protein
MSVIQGSPNDVRAPYGVLGSGSPLTGQDESGNTFTVNPVGVYGVIGSPDDVSTQLDALEAVHDFGIGPVTGAVAGVWPQVTPGTPGTPGVLKAVAFAFLAGSEPKFNQPAGVYGESIREGVMGISSGPLGAGVVGMANQSGTNLDPSTGGSGVLESSYIGVRAETQTGAAIVARTFGPGLAGLFSGNVRVQGNLEVTGAITVDGDVLLKNRDVAEHFDAIGECAPGTAMVIGNGSALQPCTRAYDKRAIGVISGAGSLRPAITLGVSETEKPTVPIAIVGTAFCLVDAEKAPIEAGDLLNLVRYLWPRYEGLGSTQELRRRYRQGSGSASVRTRRDSDRSRVAVTQIGENHRYVS